MSNFRLKSRYVYLTYSQVCENIPEHILGDHLIEQWRGLKAERFLACFERHVDGGLHVHALLFNSKQFDTLNPRFFDVAFDVGDDNHFSHPNIRKPGKSSKDLQRVKSYIRKDGNVFADDIDSASDGVPQCRDEVVENALNAASAAEAMSIVRDGLAFNYMCSFNSVRSMVAHHFPDRDPINDYDPPFPPSSFSPPLSLSEYAAQYLTEDSAIGDRPLSLIVIGPSRLGKTLWARSFGRHAYMKGLFDLSTLQDDYSYVVIDDLDLSRLSSYKEILGGQRDITLTDKYAKKIRIRHGKPAIVLTNEELPSNLDSAWMAANCIVVRIEDRLY